MADAKETSKRGLGPLIWLLLLVPAAFIYPFTPLTEIVFCPFRALIGYSCPGCGMTRSMTALAGGDVTASLAFHPGGILLVGSMLLLAGLRIADRVTGAPVFARWRRRWKRVETPIYAILLAALLGFWIWRLAGELGA